MSAPRKIELTKNKYCIVDSDDFEILNQFNWCAIQKRDVFYAGRGIWQTNTKTTKIVYMHKIILKTTLMVDHINGNTLDNRRSNLRICTNQENLRNSKLQKNSTTGFKGVYKRKDLKSKPYAASIKSNGKTKHLGYFSTKELAAIAYNEAAIKYFGEFARLNVIK